MFDIDSGKLLIVAVLALIVIGPKELPRVLRQVGQSVGKLRRMAGEFQGQFMDAMKEADLADIRKDLDDLSKTAAMDVQFDPVRDIRTELTSAMEPVAVASESTVSPAAGFDLPQAEREAELGSAGAGIAPVAEAAAEQPALVEPPSLEEAPALFAPVDDHMIEPLRTFGKRKVMVKRRTSRRNILQPDAVARSTGEPFLVQRRAVRPKAAVVEDVTTPA